MAQPVYIPNNSPDLVTMEEAENGGLKYRLTVDAEGGPSDNLCQGIFYLYDGHSESTHVHDVDEVIYVLAGNGHVRLGDREMRLSPGDTVYIPAGVPHGFTAKDNADLTVHFTFPVDRFSDVVYDYGAAA
ncbi:Cupin domain-containing protein [Roseivivax lentus]|uniref:Cupin domain-containing protein n=1 Tax=Roseivivax lentus TaxID=633194 RepID=A0A1N7MCM2_9RHOB|nr:cupin domain-containing protein [Roseivivax lentus]SIS83739.1 Cupin domain-containing protein [Roseivivax lentus]